MCCGGAQPPASPASLSSGAAPPPSWGFCEDDGADFGTACARGEPRESSSNATIIVRARHSRFVAGADVGSHKGLSLEHRRAQPRTKVSRAAQIADRVLAALWQHWQLTFAWPKLDPHFEFPATITVSVLAVQYISDAVWWLHKRYWRFPCYLAPSVTRVAAGADEEEQGLGPLFEGHPTE